MIKIKNNISALERELAVARGLASCRGDDDRLDEAEAELAELRRSCQEGWSRVAELEEKCKWLEEQLAACLDVVRRMRQ